jgi:biotin carboxylase
VLEALGVEFGPTHTEIALTTDGPRIIETHLRLGGDEIFDPAKNATGVDMIDFQVRQILGHNVLPEIRATLEAEREPRCEAIWYAAPPSVGTFVKMVEGIAKIPSNAEVTAIMDAGTDLNGLVGSFSRLAKARAHGTSAEAALASARSAIEAHEVDADGSENPQVRTSRPGQIDHEQTRCI